MKIDKQQLYELYMQEVENIANECEWKTHFTAEECVNMVVSILEKNPSLVSYTKPK